MKDICANRCLSRSLTPKVELPEVELTSQWEAPILLLTGWALFFCLFILIVNMNDKGKMHLPSYVVRRTGSIGSGGCHPCHGFRNENGSTKWRKIQRIFEWALFFVFLSLSQIWMIRERHVRMKLPKVNNKVKIPMRIEIISKAVINTHLPS